MDARTPLLEIRDLQLEYKAYGGALKVLNGVELHVHPGEKVGLVGETGCGKTSTVKAVLRVLPMPPAQIRGGSIHFKGQDVLEMNQRALRQVRGRGISMIFQDPTAALNPVFTIGEQMVAVIRSQGDERLSRRQVQAAAVEALRDVALADPARLLEAYPVQLSGGMRQRVCIAMALATKPELLIADEPGTALDVTIQDQVLRLLHNLVEERNTSVILISHSLGIVRQLTDRVYVMYAGSIVESAPTRRLFSHPGHPYTQRLMEVVPRLSGGGIAPGIPGRIPNYLDPPTGCRFHPRCPHVMEICRQHKPPAYTLEEGHQVACFLYDEHDAHRQGQAQGASAR